MGAVSLSVLATPSLARYLCAVVSSQYDTQIFQHKKKKPEDAVENTNESYY